MRSHLFVVSLFLVGLTGVSHTQAAVVTAAPASAPAKPKAAVRDITYLVWSVELLGMDLNTPNLLRDMLKLELKRVLGNQLVDMPAWVDNAILQRVAECGASAECLADAGGAMGVDRVINGVASTLGDAFNFNLKLVDTRTGKVLNKAQASFTGTRDQMLESMQALVLKLVDPTFTAGALAVELALSGVEVYVDGRLVGVTPLPGAVGNLAAGDHTLKLTSAFMKDYFTFFTVSLGKTTTVRVDGAQVQTLTAQLEATGAIETPFYKRWWFWAVAGGVAASVAGGTAYLMSRDNGNGTPGTSLGTVDMRAH
jgi:hypothetical protein